MTEAIFVERDGTIATVTLNRPERLNALDKAMWSRLGSAMQELDSDASLRCIVLRGAGDRAFAAGADISEFHAERANSKQAQAYSEGGIGWLQAVAECRHPTLALIQGACVGGGLLIASQCDLRRPHRGPRTRRSPRLPDGRVGRLRSRRARPESRVL